MFPGQGAQHVNMGLELYETESVFKAVVDDCSESLEPALGIDLREILYPAAANNELASERLKQTAMTQPALFVTKLATAKLWRSWGVHPSAMIGHSVGEYVAACLAGVFSVQDGLRLIAARGRLIQQQPTGSMLAVFRPPQDVVAFLGGSTSLAAENSPSLCVVSGPTPDIEALERELKKKDVMTRLLYTSHAFHSAMMEPVIEPFLREFQGVTLTTPRLPFVSNATGDWITDAEAVDPNYWARHLRNAVRFSTGIGTLLKDDRNLLLEVGPGATLSTLAKQDPAFGPTRWAIGSLATDRSDRSDAGSMVHALGTLWQAGAEIDWNEFYADQQRQRYSPPDVSVRKQTVFS